MIFLKEKKKYSTGIQFFISKYYTNSLFCFLFLVFCFCFFFFLILVFRNLRISAELRMLIAGFLKLPNRTLVLPAFHFHPVSTKVRLLSDDKRESQNSKHRVLASVKSCPTLIIELFPTVALQNSPQKKFIQSFKVFFCIFVCVIPQTCVSSSHPY